MQNWFDYFYLSVQPSSTNFALKPVLQDDTDSEDRLSLDGLNLLDGWPEDNGRILIATNTGVVADRLSLSSSSSFSSMISLWSEASSQQQQQQHQNELILRSVIKTEDNNIAVSPMSTASPTSAVTTADNQNNNNNNNNLYNSQDLKNNNNIHPMSQDTYSLNLMASKSGQTIQTLTPPSSPESMSTSGLLRVTAPATSASAAAGAIVRVTARAGGSLPRYISFSPAATAVAFPPATASAAAAAAAALAPAAPAAVVSKATAMKSPSASKPTRLDMSPEEDSKRRIHKCNFLNCKKVYTKSSHLKAHQRTHTGRSQFK